MLPTMFEHMLRSTSEVHDNSARQTDLLYVQYASTIKRTIEYFGTKLWKSLCIVIDVAIITFKQRLKYFLWSWFLSILDVIVILKVCIIYIIFLNLPYYHHYSLCFHKYFCSFLNRIHSSLHFVPCFLLTTYTWILLFPWISGTWVLTSAPFARVIIPLCF